MKAVDAQITLKWTPKAAPQNGPPSRWSRPTRQASGMRVDSVPPLAAIGPISALAPSMRRPAPVRESLSSMSSSIFSRPAKPPLSPPFHPHSPANVRSSSAILQQSFVRNCGCAVRTIEILRQVHSRRLTSDHIVTRHGKGLGFVPFLFTICPCRRIILRARTGGSLTGSRVRCVRTPTFMTRIARQYGEIVCCDSSTLHFPDQQSI